jgi:rod shape determining protein RodA
MSVLRSMDKTLVALPAFFACVSLAVIISITYNGGSYLTRSAAVQGAAFIIGYIAIFAITMVDYKSFCKYEAVIYVLSIGLQLLVYTPLGTDMGTGSRAWLNLGPLTMQPSEFVKVSFVVIFATFLSRNRKNLASIKGVLMSLAYSAPFLALIMKEDFGSGLVLAVMCVGMVFYAGIDRKLFARFAIAGALAVPILYGFMKDYQKQRIDGFLHPDNLSISATYHVYQAKVAIGSGGFFGKGLFSGTQKELNFLPVQQSDFIFAVTAEELGFIGAGAVIFLYLVFMLRMGRGISRAKDMYGALIVVGMLTMFAFQVFENIGMNMGLMPVTGIPLPLISAGGTAVVAHMSAIGFVLNVGIRNKTFIFSNNPF